MTLNELPVGMKGRILKIKGDPAFVWRLSDLGLTHNTLIHVLKKGMFHGPVIIEVRSYVLAIRSQEAACIEVEKTNP